MSMRKAPGAARPAGGRAAGSEVLHRANGGLVHIAGVPPVSRILQLQLPVPGVVGAEWCQYPYPPGGRVSEPPIDVLANRTEMLFEALAIAAEAREDHPVEEGDPRRLQQPSNAVSPALWVAGGVRDLGQLAVVAVQPVVVGALEEL